MDANGVLAQVYDVTTGALKTTGSSATGNPAPALAPTASQVAASATATVGAANSATLPAVAGKTNYVTGFTISAGAAVAIVSGVATLTGVVGGTQSYQFVEPSASGGLLSIDFSTPLAASAANTAVAINIPAITGGAATAAVIRGLLY